MTLSSEKRKLNKYKESSKNKKTLWCISNFHLQFESVHGIIVIHKNVSLYDSLQLKVQFSIFCHRLKARGH